MEVNTKIQLMEIALAVLIVWAAVLSFYVLSLRHRAAVSSNKIGALLDKLEGVYTAVNTLKKHAALADERSTALYKTAESRKVIYNQNFIELDNLIRSVCETSSQHTRALQIIGALILEAQEPEDEQEPEPEPERVDPVFAASRALHTKD